VGPESGVERPVSMVGRGADPLRMGRPGAGPRPAVAWTGLAPGGLCALARIHRSYPVLSLISILRKGLSAIPTTRLLVPVGSRRDVSLHGRCQAPSKAKTGFQNSQKGLASFGEADGIVRPTSRTHCWFGDASSSNREYAYGKCPTQASSTNSLRIHRDFAARNIG